MWILLLPQTVIWEKRAACELGVIRNRSEVTKLRKTNKTFIVFTMY